MTRFVCTSCGKPVSEWIEGHIELNPPSIITCIECHSKDVGNSDKINEAFTLALQYVPLEGKDADEQKEIDKIYNLIKETRG